MNLEPRVLHESRTADREDRGQRLGAGDLGEIERLDLRELRWHSRDRASEKVRGLPGLPLVGRDEDDLGRERHGAGLTC